MSEDSHSKKIIPAVNPRDHEEIMKMIESEPSKDNQDIQFWVNGPTVKKKSLLGDLLKIYGSYKNDRQRK